MEIEDAKPTIDLAIFKVNIAIVGTVFFYFHFFISKISQGRNRFMVYLQLLRFRHLVFSKKNELILKPVSGNFTTQLPPVLLTPTQANQICTYLTVKTSLVVVLP